MASDTPRVRGNVSPQNAFFVLPRRHEGFTAAEAEPGESGIRTEKDPGEVMTSPEDRLALLNKRDDLPEELKQQLCKIPPKDWLRVQIVEVIREHGVLNVDEILVGLWRGFKKMTTKKTVYQRLSELCDTGEIERVKPGHYRVKEAA